MKKLRMLLTVFLVSCLMTGCTSGTTGAVAPSTGSSEAVLYVATDTDLSTMDHHVATDGTSFIAQSLIFSGLTQLNANNAPEPDVATNWDISDDGLVYTFHLDPAAKWTNGDEVTADDFVYSWQRLADPAMASEYQFIVGTINLLNADEVMAGTKQIGRAHV